MAGMQADYMIVKDFCEKYELDSIDTYSIVKRIVSEVYAKS